MRSLEEQGYDLRLTEEESRVLKRLEQERPVRLTEEQLSKLEQGDAVRLTKEQQRSLKIAYALAAEAPEEAGLAKQEEERLEVRGVARDAARRQFEKDLTAAKITVASEGVDPATRISDIHDPAAYDALRRQDPDELAGAVLDAERDNVYLAHENAHLREENARLKKEAEQDRESLRS